MKITFKDKLPKGFKKAVIKPEELKGINLRKFILLVRKQVSEAKKDKQKKLAILLRDLPNCSTLSVEQGEMGEIIAREILLADYEFTKYLSKPKEGWDFLTEVALVGPASREASQDFKKGIERGRVVAGEVNACRELSNTPGGEMTPLHLAEAARQASRGTPIKVTVMGRKEMEKEGMGAVLGVAKGSPAEPQFIVMEYWGAGGPTSPSFAGPTKTIGLSSWLAKA
ncbi:MAG TPA: hypothetical protein VI953_04905 [Candidatus Paceibacterota bacterium]